MSVRITSFAISESGSRPYNEDAYADKDLMAGRCAVVADGAGGHRGGAIASRLVIDAVMLSLAQAPRWNEAALIASVDAASIAIGQRQRSEPELREMASTVALLCIDASAGTARWAHLGDTRIILFRNGSIETLTRDHSIRQSFVDAGLAHGLNGAGPDRTMLYAAVGAEGDVRPSLGVHPALEDGDAFLVCSDGVWDTVDATRVSELLTHADSVEEWIKAVDAAVREAAKTNQDNYTALGLWVGSLAAPVGKGR